MKSQDTRNLDQYREIYSQPGTYGKSSARKADEVWGILTALAALEAEGQLSVLDFGCGRSNLIDLLEEKDAAADQRFAFHRYDPAIPEYSSCPLTEADFVINTDVLEHLDENEIDLLLTDIFRISGNCYFRVSTRVAKTILPSGENAHATVQNSDWWVARMRPYAKHLTVLPSKTDQLIVLAHERPELGAAVLKSPKGGGLWSRLKGLFAAKTGDVSKRRGKGAQA